MEVTRTDDDVDVFIGSKFAVQCYSEDPKCRGRSERATPQSVTPSDWSSFAISWCVPVTIASVLVWLRRRSFLICHLAHLHMQRVSPVQLVTSYWWPCPIVCHQRIGGTVFQMWRWGCRPVSWRWIIAAPRESSPVVHRRTTLPSGSGNWRRWQLFTPDKIWAQPLKNHNVDAEEVLCYSQKMVMIEGIKHCSNV